MKIVVQKIMKDKTKLHTKRTQKHCTHCRQTTNTMFARLKNSSEIIKLDLINPVHSEQKCFC